MRRAWISFVLITGAICSAEAQKVATPEALQAQVDRLKASADAATGQVCAEVCLEAANQLTELSNQNFIDGHVAPAQANMRDAGKYAEKAARESMQSRKRQKKTEIGLRRLTKRMKDIVQTLNFEDRAPVQQVIRSVEKARIDLLSSMFGNPPKTFEQLDGKNKEKK